MIPTRTSNEGDVCTSDVDEWIDSWPTWERDAAEAILQKEMGASYKVR